MQNTTTVRSVVKPQNKKSCFGKGYCKSAVECSNCVHSGSCSEHVGVARQTCSPIREAVLAVLEDAWLSCHEIRLSVKDALGKDGNISSLHYHLCLLKKSGQITIRRSGTKVYYGRM